jgi:periplasmic mercuric ion binding protein
MNKKILSITLSIIGSTFFALPALAGEKVEVKVKGMVCSFCATGIKKKFNGNDAVSKIEVNLDDKWVKLELADNKTLSDEKIKSLIEAAGYDVVSVSRTSESPAKKDI